MKIEINELSIVVVGQFNPIIFQPYWFAFKGLIPESEAENADKNVLVHDEFVRFDLEWASFEVQKKRLQIRTTKQSHFNVVVDLMQSIFSILRNTPLSAIGINHIFHFQFDEKGYLELGEKLAPFDNWNNILNPPRLNEIVMIENPRTDDFKGQFRVRIAPSEILQTFGVGVYINDHITSTEKKPTSGEEIMKALITNWPRSLDRANQTVDQLWKNLKV